MEGSGDEAQPQKKRRVTKACDQCRRRRIKCESFPKAAIDAPCVICTNAGTANECTYTRPTKKRGPQAGKAKTMEDKVQTFERLLGHLSITIPNLNCHIEAFVASSQSPSSPGSASSSTAVLTTPEQQQAAFASSSIGDMLESILPPNPAANKERKDSKTPKMDIPSPAPTVFSQSTPTPSTSTSTAPLPLPLGPSAAAAQGRKIAPLPSSSAGGPSPFAPAAAQASASGVVYGDEKGKAVVRGDTLDIPTLPSEGLRNQLFDLYFNQVVHPHYPMLDKSRFLRWSAHLPSVPSTSSSPHSPLLIPPALYLSVFALATAYLPPEAAKETHLSAVWAKAARAHLMEEVLSGKATVETVQAAVLCALSDWGAGELDRAWMLSGLSLTVAINLSLHLSATLPPDPDSYKLKTFHSALIPHTLLSLRLDRPPLIVLEDYDVPIPPDDGAENFELWRSDKTVSELREEWLDGDVASPMVEISGVGAGRASTRLTQAVRSAALSTFSRTASLCAIGVAVLRWNVCPRRGNGQGLASGEQERAELVASLAAWEEGLPVELRLGEGVRMVERLGERARWTVELHMVAASLYLKLKPHPSFTSVPDPLPQSLGLLSHILNRYRDLFTLYRSLPSVELVLHTLAATLFQQSDYAPHYHDTVLRAYAELGRVFGVAKKSWETLSAKVDEHKRELGLLRGVHPTASTHPAPLASTTAPAPIAGPFEALLSYSNELGPGATSSTVLDFGMWDQTDLLVSLGLVVDNGTPATTATGGTSATVQLQRSPQPPQSLALPLPIPAAGDSLALPRPPVIPPSSAAPLPQQHISPPPELQQTSPAMAISPPAASAPPTASPHLPAPPPSLPQPPPPIQQHFPPTFHYPPVIPGTVPPPFYPAYAPDPAAAAAFGLPPPFAYPPFPPPVGAFGAPLFDDRNFSAQPGDWPSTDMVTRWMDRGSLYGGFEGLGAPGAAGGAGGAPGGASNAGGAGGGGG
ncbi:hypothetical protein JCM10213_000565 [Rhodosporidiobolus nylandii]